MEGLWILLVAAVVLFIPFGSILGFLAYQNFNKQAVRLNGLSDEVNELREQLRRHEARLRESVAVEAKSRSAAVDPPELVAPVKSLNAERADAALNGARDPLDLGPQQPSLPELRTSPIPAAAFTAPPTAKPQPQVGRAAAQAAHATDPSSAPFSQPALAHCVATTAPSRFMQSLKNNWMVWLGGLSVALAGIFMVHYSVSEGWIGPKLQLLLALSVGGLLHGGAEYLRRRTGYTNPIFAALAGGGSVTLYAALLAGMHHYYLIGPLLGLVLLAGVSLGTMVLARLHGPLLALMGLSGAYIVPLLIDSESGSITFVLSYSLLITVSSLLLMRYVYRNWLWYATLAGALLWWALVLFDTLIGNDITLHLPVYVSALWLSFSYLPNRILISTGRLRDGFVMLLAAWAISIAGQPSVGQTIGINAAVTPLFWSWLLLLPAALLMPQSRRALWYLPWGALLATAAGWLLYLTGMNLDTIDLQQFPLDLHAGFGRYLILAALISSGLGFWQWRLADKPRWASLVLLSPLVWLTLGWLLIPGTEPSVDWALGALLAATVYGALAWQLPKYQAYKSGVVWAVLAAHLSYSLAVVMALREASLTLGLAVQLVTLVWLARRYQLPQLHLLLKVVLAIVVARLTLNPWLTTYDAQTHWSLWTYGGSAALAALATYLSDRAHAIRPWLEAASLHLLVLFLGAELRYWLYDGDIFSHQYSFTEATINTLLWGGLSITYMLRAKAAQQLAWLYRGCAMVLLGLSSLSYFILVSRYNPLLGETYISDTPLFNMLLPAYGGPVLLALALSRLPSLLSRTLALTVAGGAFMLFSALEIRQLWRGSDMALWLGIENGELYTYSAVGMLYAIAAIIYATKHAAAGLYKIGMILLGLVIAKIFIIDMHGLQGLWRVAAFMGLGLALLGLAWMHQKVQRAVRTAPSA